MFYNALNIATQAHFDKVGEDGNPHIFHCIRLAMKFTYEDYQVVALLHDAVDGERVSIGGLAASGFSEDIISALSVLKVNQEESYDAYVARVRKNPIAAAVLREDISDTLEMNNVSPEKTEDLSWYIQTIRRLNLLKNVEEAPEEALLLN